MIRTSVAIVGSGIAGLAADRKLRVPAIDPVMLENGRGLIGRMATRRVDEARSASGEAMANSANSSLGGDSAA